MCSFCPLVLWVLSVWGFASLFLESSSCYFWKYFLPSLYFCFFFQTFYSMDFTLLLLLSISLNFFINDIFHLFKLPWCLLGEFLNVIFLLNNLLFFCVYPAFWSWLMIFYFKFYIFHTEHIHLIFHCNCQFLFHITRILLKIRKFFNWSISELCSIS